MKFWKLLSSGFIHTGCHSCQAMNSTRALNKEAMKEDINIRIILNKYKMNLSHTTAQKYCITVMHSIKHIPICLHNVFKWPKEVFLKAEICKFSLLQKLHRQLPKRINCKECYVFIRVASNLQGHLHEFTFSPTHHP